MLIGDSEIYTDQFIPAASFRGQKPSHQELLMKAIEGFALSEDLLHIKSKMIQIRFLEETSPFAKIMWRIFMILLAPAIILGFGVFRMIMRRDKRLAYKRLLEQAGGKYNIDFKSSWFIGDTESDIKTGKKAGCRTHLLKKGESLFSVVKRIVEEWK